MEKEQILDTQKEEVSVQNASKSIEETVLVLHVKHGYDERARHIEKMMSKQQIPFLYILDGDIEDLTDEIKEAYFKIGDTELFRSSTISCAYKHFLAYQYILEHNLRGALILEDDVILSNNFLDIFNKCMNEYEKMRTDDILISFENSRLRFVPRSKRVKGQYLYKGDKDRMTGAYYISKGAAKRIIDYVKRNKCDRPIDWLHALLIREENFPYYWCQPPVVTQGSFIGKFQSSISTDKKLYAGIVWRCKYLYKKLLYFFR